MSSCLEPESNNYSKKSVTLRSMKTLYYMRAAMFLDTAAALTCSTAARLRHVASNLFSAGSIRDCCCQSLQLAATDATNVFILIVISFDGTALIDHSPLSDRENWRFIDYRSFSEYNAT